MAGYQLNRSTEGSTDWTSWIDANEEAWKGFINISLNNWDTTGVPSVAEGGSIEVGGSIFYFGDTEAITGTPSTANLNYIMVTSSSSNVTVSYTTTAPTWVADKGGWYDATEAKRYAGGCGIDLGNKFIYQGERLHGIGIDDDSVTGKIVIDGIEEQGSGSAELKARVNSIGDWDMNVDATYDIAHGLTLANIRSVSGIIRNDDKDQCFVVGNDYYINDIGITYIDATNIRFARRGGGAFDSTDYEDVGGAQETRGWVTIWYKV